MRFPRLIAVLAAAFALGSCSSSGDPDVPDFPTVITLGAGELFPGILNTSLSVGPNRVVWNLIDTDDNPVLDADLRIRYFNLNTGEPRLTEALDARLVSSDLSFVDEASGKERTVVGTGGVYVTPATFDEAGDWGAEVKITRGADVETILYRFSVREDSEEPSIGDPAPATVQATTATAPLEEIDSSFPLREAMHQTTVADALQAEMPIVIAFATPAFCTSRTCGPVLDDVVDPLFERYGNEVTFIHIEPYELRAVRESNRRNPVPAALEWRLRTEPWVFVVGADGRVAAKFEGIVALDEVEAALKDLLGSKEPAAGSSPGNQ